MSKSGTQDSGHETRRSDFERLDTLRDRLALTRLVDRARFTRELDRLYARRDRGNDFESAFDRLGAAIVASIAKVEALRAQALNLTYDPALPITSHREEILRALEKHQVIVLCGATGSGKTTQLPKYCLEAGRGAFASDHGDP